MTKHTDCGCGCSGIEERRRKARADLDAALARKTPRKTKKPFKEWINSLIRRRK